MEWGQKMVKVLNSFIYNAPMNIKPYVKIDNKWYRARCNSCGKLIQRIHQELCKDCWVKSIQGQVRVVHNKPHTKEAKKKISQKKQKTQLTYEGIHNWLRRDYGVAKECRNKLCKGTSKKYNWANITGEYKKDLSHYTQLCTSCHISYDRWGHEIKL